MRGVKVLIADDHAAVLAGLVNLLKNTFDVVGAVSNGDLLIEAAAKLRPDVIVTDISMPGLNGMEALRRLRSASSDAKIIVLTMHADAEVAATAIRTGASGFVVKLSAANELVAAIHEALRGSVYVSPEVMTGPLADVPERHQ